MTETNRYNNGKIYKLISPHTDLIYVGSTCKERLCQRLASHRMDYKRWLKYSDKYSYTTSFKLFDLGDVEIILLESINCMTKDELLKKEREWIEKLKDNIVNKQRPITTKEEHKEEKKQYDKVYREENKEKLKEKNKEYYKEQIQCDCGSVIIKNSKSRHTKTQTHQQYINSLVSKSVLKT